MSATAEKRGRLAMPLFVQPSLATLVSEPPATGEWAHEIKFDGYRLQARIDGKRVRLWTRSGLDWTDKFGSLAEKIAALPSKAAILDGEVIVEDEHGASSFSELVADLHAGNTGRMVFCAFDLLYLDGKDIRGAPLGERKQLLSALLIKNRKKSPALRFSEHVIGKGPEMLAGACGLGLEGIISKRLDKPYRSGRNSDWLKSKCIQSDEFVICGFLDSAAEKLAVGALVLGYFKARELIYAGRVGTGFSRSVARELFALLQPLKIDQQKFAVSPTAMQRRAVHWVKPRLVAQVTYRSWTGDGLLRHASFEALRADKPPEQIKSPKLRTPA
jgi:bifunctional non-homologous end joining protein LigD